MLMTLMTTSPKPVTTTPRASLESWALIRRLFLDHGQFYWRHYSLAFVCMALMAGSTSISAWIMRDVIDKVFIAKNLDALWAITAVLVVISLVKGFATYGQQVTLASIANGIVAEVQRKIFDKMMRMSVGFYAARHSSDFIARQSYICQSCSTTLNMLITALSRDILTLLGLASVMILQDPFMSLLGLVFMPVAVLGVRRLAKKVRKFRSNEFSGYAKVMESLQEAAQGIRIVKSYTLEPFMRAKQFAAIEQFRKATNKVARVSATSSPLMEAMGGLAIALVVMYGGWHVISRGNTPGTFFSFITALLMAYDPAKRVARLHVDLNSALLGVKMLYEFLDETDEEKDTDDAPALRITSADIKFTNVSFSYRDDEHVLSHLNLHIIGGKTTALVGKSGGGKSTIMSLLMRYWEPTHGHISIDGQNISSVNRASLRQHIAYVSQDVFLFNGTIKDNIRIGHPDASDDEIIAAAKAAYAHDFIMSFESGYDTECGEHGTHLSGGQRQRISIARAFLKNAPILLLDEATSALDAESERAIQDAINQLKLNRTTLIIAHRLSTIRNADQICVVAGGHIVESGSHEKLMQTQHDYVALVSAQMK
jgi:ATP-binding cassette, subfamily B, bacterial MsbA